MRLKNKKTNRVIDVKKLELNNGSIILTYTIEQKASYDSLVALNEEWVEEAEEEPFVVASRGREPEVLRPVRNEYGKAIRKKYEAGKIKAKRSTMQQLEPRMDGVTNTITTVQKDNYVAIPSKLQKEVCNQAIEKGLVVPNDAIEYTYSNARLNEIKQGFIRKQNTIDNQVMSTLKTNPQQIGVCVETKKQSFGVRPLKIKTANQKGYDEAVDGDGVDLQYPSSTTRRGRVGHGVCKTIMTGDNMGVVHNYRIRKLTPKECWRLMGFDDTDFEKAAKVNSNTQLYKQAGNSIVVNVLEAILNNLL